MPLHLVFFFVNNAATTATYTLSLHDALPICNFPGRTGHNPRVLGAASVVLAATAMLAVHHSTGGQSWYSGVGSGYLFAAGLILIGSRLETPRIEVDRAARHFGGGWALLPYVPIVLAVAAVAIEQVQHGTLDPVLVWVLLATFTLVLV